jgi:hypothetical protein
LSFFFFFCLPFFDEAGKHQSEHRGTEITTSIAKQQLDHPGFRVSKPFLIVNDG